MDKQILTLYLNLMREAAQSKSFMILLSPDEIDEMKQWCRVAHCRYNFSHHNQERTSFYYEIFPI